MEKPSGKRMGGKNLSLPFQHKNYPEFTTGVIEELISAIGENKQGLISLITELVSFPSLLGNEEAAQIFMDAKFREMGLSVERFDINHEKLQNLPGYSPPVGKWKNHYNVVGSFKPKVKRGKSLILNGHIDVVPVGDERLWTKPPFKPYILNDLLFGRGSGDMKAGIAAYIIAFEAFKTVGIEPAAEIIMQSVVEEECTGNGALACLHKGYKADAAIIPEPFNNTIMSAQVGVMWLRVEVLGKPSHVLNSNDGTNAIEGAFELWQGLKNLCREWNDNQDRPAAFKDADKPIKFNLGLIRGGEWASSLATCCEMDLRVGFFPGTSVSEVCSQIENRLRDTISNNKQLSDINFKISYGGFQSEGCIVDLNNPFITTLTQSHRTIFKTQPEYFASAATTDAKIFNLYGDIPATCYGPEARNIHGIDECVSLESTLNIAKVLAVFIANWCGFAQLN